jgi:RecA-family ATPase
MSIDNMSIHQARRLSKLKNSLNHFHDKANKNRDIKVKFSVDGDRKLKLYKDPNWHGSPIYKDEYGFLYREFSYAGKPPALAKISETTKTRI